MRSRRTATREKPERQRRPSTARNEVKKTTKQGIKECPTTPRKKRQVNNEQYNLRVLKQLCFLWKSQKHETAFPVVPWFWINREVFGDGKFKCSCFDMETSTISSLSQPTKYPSPSYNFGKSLELAFLPALICKGCTWLGFDSGEIILKGES